MRRRLLVATVECLVVYGYAATTTYRVAELAGVTRGAQFHHFRSREDLVVAAVDYLAQARIDAVMRHYARIAGGADSVGDVLEFLWDCHKGSIFVAAMELWAAARTDPILAQRLAEVESAIDTRIVTAVAWLVPGAAPRDLCHGLYTAMDVLRGVLLAGCVDRDVGKARKRWERACVPLRHVLAAAVSGDQAPPETL